MGCVARLALPYRLPGPQHIVGNNQRENSQTKEMYVTLISRLLLTGYGQIHGYL